MAEKEVADILAVFDNYITILESPDIGEKITVENAEEVMDCCRFIEATVACALVEDKAKCLESHLKAHWMQQNRTSTYTIDQLQSATDRMLESFLKDRTVSTLVIDKLLEYYTQFCGVERLNIFLGNLLTNTMSTNTIIKSMSELGMSKGTLEDEVILAAWENEAACGRCHEVSMCINEMLKDSEILKVVRFVSRLDNESVVKKLIMQRLTIVASECKPDFYATFTNIDHKLFNKVFCNSDFLTYFLDGIFYFGRNMTFQDGSWQCEHAFDYKCLVRTMRNLFKCHGEVRKITDERLELEKLQPDSNIWIDVENDIR